MAPPFFVTLRVRIRPNTCAASIPDKHLTEFFCVAGVLRNWEFDSEMIILCAQ